MPGYFTHLKKEASIICDDVPLIMEACFNLRYCGFTRLIGFIQGSFDIWMRYWINSRRAVDRMLAFSVHCFYTLQLSYPRTFSSEIRVLKP